MNPRATTGPFGQPQPACASAPSVPVPRVSSADLMRNATELIIVHGSREYRLRVTSNGKLILTA